MKRRGFIKALAAACVIPAVAARAIASHRKLPKSLLDYKPTAAYSLRRLDLDEHGNAYSPTWYDQSGNGNHLLTSREVCFDSVEGWVKMKPANTINDQC